MRHRGFAAAVHDVQLRQGRVQREGGIEPEGGVRELCQRATRCGEVGVTDGGHGRQAIEPVAQDHEHEALPAR